MLPVLYKYEHKPKFSRFSLSDSNNFLFLFREKRMISLLAELIKILRHCCVKSKFGVYCLTKRYDEFFLEFFMKVSMSTRRSLHVYRKFIHRK